MLKKIGVLCALGLMVSASLGARTVHNSPNQDQKIVAWDIHEVLCSKPKFHGWKCTPNEQTFQIVRALHEKGVKQVIFSNISKKSFAKLVCLYPEHFSYFNMGSSVASAKGIFDRKPHGRYIKKLLKKNNVCPANIIFFDDKRSNVRGACKHGIDAHLFSSPAQALEVLQAKGLC